MVIYHQGTDAGSFDYVEINTKEGNTYGCNFYDKGLIDNNDYAKSTDCFEQ